MTHAPSLTARILDTPRQGRRRLIALAGTPASGKSTLANQLAKTLTKTGCPAQVVPMDGFHLDNPILAERGLLDRKGAPQTFDAAGFRHLVARLHNEDDVYYPVFDRGRDIATAGAGLLDSGCDTVIIEGNYLLYDAPVWRDLLDLWDLSIRLDIPLATLKGRLVKRWRTYGASEEEATARMQRNDLPNAELVLASSLPADITISG